jgi:hypothetical protein
VDAGQVNVDVRQIKGLIVAAISRSASALVIALSIISSIYPMSATKMARGTMANESMAWGLSMIVQPLRGYDMRFMHRSRRCLVLGNGLP